MSQRKDVNPESPIDHLPTELRQVFSAIEPEPLDVDRDQLFFQAGFAAAQRRDQRGRFIWPLAAAALLLVSAGLGVILLHQSGSINALQTELAGLRSADFTSSFAGTPDAPTLDSDPLSPLRLREQQNLLRLISAEPLPPGQLTAMGLIDAGDRAQLVPSAASTTTAPAPFQRPATYLELLRSQQEG